MKALSIPRLALAKPCAPARGLFSAICIALASAAPLVTACGGDGSPPPPAGHVAPAAQAYAPVPPTNPGTIKVVTGNAVLADIAAQVGGARVSVSSLVPTGSDAHTWRSTPQDSVRLAQADVIVSNGSGLSAQVEELIGNAGSPDAVIVIASEGLEPQRLVQLPFPKEQYEPAEPGHNPAVWEKDDHDQDHGEGDPHFWLNPRLVVHYVNQIANGFIAADPDQASMYLDNAATYISELETLDSYISDTLAVIPAEHRVIVTFHDAFGYFGTRYDMEVWAFVGSHAGEVSPDDIARVLDLVNEQGLPGVFAEPQFSADALRQVARDTGIDIGYIRSFPDNTQTDYIGMMRENAETLAELLR